MGVIKQNCAGLPRTLEDQLSRAQQRAASAQERARSAVQKSRALIARAQEAISVHKTRHQKTANKRSN